MLAKRGNDVAYIACVLHPFWRIRNGGYVEFTDGPIKVCAYSGLFLPHMTDPLIPFPYLPGSRNRKWETLLERTEEVTGFPDVIHIHFPLMVLSSEVFEKYRERGAKVIVTEHWTKVLNKKLDKYEMSQMMSYLGFADAYTAVGYTLKRAIIEISDTNREILVIPNIINDVFRPLYEEHRDFRFGLVGRLSAQKQMDKAIEAFAMNFKERNDVKLIIVGDGTERENLLKLVSTLGVDAQVEFKGLLDREDTAAIVKTLDCFVCFSSYETFGVPVIEAWACGVPVITTTADCITDRWDERLGISVCHTDTEALKEAMKRMVDRKDRYDRDYISDYAISHYSEDCVYSELMAVYT